MNGESPARYTKRWNLPVTLLLRTIPLEEDVNWERRDGFCAQTKTCTHNVNPVKAGEDSGSGSSQLHTAHASATADYKYMCQAWRMYVQTVAVH